MTVQILSEATLARRELLTRHHSALEQLFEKYKAKNPRLFGSVARGDANDQSDIDILVEMNPADGNILLRASGLMEETRELLGREDIDIFPDQLLKKPVAERALTEAMKL